MKRFFCLLFVFLLLCGCGSSPYTILQYDLSSPVQTLDPQFASTDAEKTVAANLFEGLVRSNADGSLSPACADSWEISPDGLTYRFTLKDGLVWSNGERLTADDFVFGLSRLFESGTPSPHAQAYSAIAGAKAALAGTGTATLGLSAPDEKTLVIRLDTADDSFLSLLARPAASPCSRTFFEEQKGRYGLSDEHLLTNGALSLYSWGQSSIRLRRAKESAFSCTIDGLDLNLSAADAQERFLAGETSACLGGEALYSQTGASLFYDRTWALILNPGSEAFQDETLRSVLLGALSGETLSFEEFSYAKKAEGLLPPASIVGSLPYRTAAGAALLPAYPADPRQTMLDAFTLLETDRFAKATLLVADDAAWQTLGGEMQRRWSESLSAYFNMEPVSESVLLSRVSSGNFDLAIVPLPLSGEDGAGGLSLFGTLCGEESGISSLIGAVSLQTSDLGRAKAISAVENAVLSACLAYPLFDTPSVFACRDGVTGVWYDPVTHIVYFKDAAAA